MTLDQVDAELAFWKKTLGAAAQNLMDLHSLPAYQRLAGSNGVAQVELEGETAARVYPSLDSMGKLFQSFDALQSTIDRACALRVHVSPLFGSEQKLRELEALLHGRSIELPAAAIPIEQRTLSSSVDNFEKISPSDLMGAMDRSFTAARDVVLAVDAAWEKLGMALDRAATDLAACAGECRQWNANVPVLGKAETVLENIRKRIESDPLAALTQFEAVVEPALQEARSVLGNLKVQRNQISSDLSAARRVIDQLKEVHEKCFAVWQERQLKVSCSKEPAVPQDEAQIALLSDWLKRLGVRFQEGMLDPISVGLEKWNIVANKCVSDERAALESNQVLLKERNELRGRLDALKAKARARGCAEDRDLTRIATQATQLLFTRPTPIEKASALVIDYEQTLRSQPGLKEKSH